jgi:hypothetical protein
MPPEFGFHWANDVLMRRRVRNVEDLPGRSPLKGFLYYLRKTLNFEPNTKDL